MKERLLAVALTAVLMTVPSAYAAKSGWYVGAGAGQSKARDLGDLSVTPADLEDIVAELRGEELDEDLLTDMSNSFDASQSLDDKDTGWKVYAGYRVNENFAIEAGYTRLGKFGYQGSFDFYITGYDYEGSASLKGRAKAWTLSALGIVPLGQQFELFGKLGLARWDVKTTANITVNQDGDSYSESTSVSKKGTGLNFGLGAVYKFNANLGIRAEWERFNDVGKEDVTGKSDIDLLSIGLMYSF